MGGAIDPPTPRSVGTPLPTAVAGTASFVDGELPSQASLLGPQQLISALPAALQPSSTLFYYNPQEEDLMLQQAALQQTGQASFVSGLTYDNKNNLSVTDQEKAILYQNAINYAGQNDVQLGVALTQTQINALTHPMLWYVEQTVPDPTCEATGTATCPTITALMPQVYLPANSSALSAGGNIEAGNSLSLDFGSAATGGSITNTGSIASGGTLTVNTGTLTNEANQVNVGQIWNSVKGGYTDTTGTVVQPGGFMSAADMQLNVATLSQIGGALQQLDADGTVDQAGTQQLLAQLQQQLGGDFTQQTLSNNLNTDFVKQGGSFGLTQLLAIVAAVVATIVTYGAASAAIGAAAGATDAASSAAIGAAAEGGAAMSTAAAEAGGTFMAATAGASAGLGNIVLSAGIAGMAGSLTSQIISTGSVNWGAVGEAGLVGALTAGLTNGITYNTTNGFGFTTGATTAADPSLASLGGVLSVGNSLVPQATGTATSNLPAQVLALGGDAAISAGVQSVVEGGSFLDALKNSLASDSAAVGAYAIGNAGDDPDSILAKGSIGYDLAHAALGCAASAAEGTGCAGGAIGGAASALVSPYLVDQAGGAANLTDPQRAAIVGTAALLGGLASGLAGQNAEAGATAAENEAVNNSTAIHESEQQKEAEELQSHLSKERAMLGEGSIVDEGDGVSVVAPSPLAFGGASNSGEAALTPSQQATAWQGSGAYPGVDSYTDVVLPKGSYVVGAAPGQSSYYTSLQGFFGTDGSAESYYQALQIQPNLTNPAYPAYRSGVTIYQVTGDTPAAFSSATTANPQYGAGGAPQFFIPGYQDSLTPIFSIPFKK